jgi:hypothetical protein
MTSLVDGRYFRWFPELLLSALLEIEFGSETGIQRHMLMFLKHNIVPSVLAVLCLVDRHVTELVRNLCLLPAISLYV